MPRERFSFFDGGGGGGGGSSVADLIMSGGRAQADAELRRGAATADTINAASQALQGIGQDYFKRRDDKKVQGAVRAAVMPGATRATPAFDAQGNPIAETTGPDVRGILDKLPPELQGRAMKGIQDWQEMIGKRAESDARLTKLQQEIEETKKTRQQHDADTLAVGAHHVSQLLDSNSPSAGLIGANGLYAAAQGAGLADDKMDTFMSGANEAWQAAQGDPQREAMFKEAFQAQAGPILESLKQRGSASVQEKFAPKTRTVTITNADGSKTERIVEDKIGQEFASAAPRDTRSLELQRAEATAKGDTATAASLLRQMAEEARAKQDPSAGGFNLSAGETRFDRSGRAIASLPAKATAPQKLTKEERQDFAAWDYALPKLDGFANYVKTNPGKYGKWDSFAAGLKQQVPGFADSDYATQKAFVGRMNAEIRHALYGSALTEGEKETANDFLISEKDQPEVIVSKINEAANRARSYREYYTGLGFNLPAPAGGARPIPDGGQTTKAQYDALPKGAVYTDPTGQKRTKQ